jgi:hypothetical protein
VGHAEPSKFENAFLIKRVHQLYVNVSQTANSSALFASIGMVIRTIKGSYHPLAGASVIS